MLRRQFLKAAALSAISFSASSTCAVKKSRPNIILIMADDLGYECLGCNGSTSYKTPHLDHLAASGVRFTHAHSQPLCTPSRVQIMTGQYNFRNYTQFGALKPGEYTFGHLLQGAGYKTCLIGKWQLAARVKDASYRGEGTLPEHAGFDEHCLWQVNFKGSRYWEPSIRTNGELQKDIAGKYGPDIFCDYGLDFIERHKDQRFFLYFPMALTHDPFVPTPDSDLSETEREDVKNIKSDPVYFSDMVAYMDKLVGRFVEKLKKLKLSDRTVLIFTGDNGTHRSILSETRDGPVRGAKGQTITAGTHVPFIVNWSGIAASGLINENLIDFTDVFPTLAEISGAQHPADRTFDGISFLPHIKGKDGPSREWIFCHYEPKWGKWKPARFVMDKRWKLYDDGRFYDVVNDPLEAQPVEELSDEMTRIRDKFETVLKNKQ